MNPKSVIRALILTQALGLIGAPPTTAQELAPDGGTAAAAPAAKGGELATFTAALPGAADGSALQKLVTAYKEASAFDSAQAKGRWIGLFVEHLPVAANSPDAKDYFSQALLQVTPVELGALESEVTLQQAAVFQIDPSLSPYSIDGTLLRSMPFSASDLVSTLPGVRIEDGAAVQTFTVRGIKAEEWKLRTKIYRNDLIVLASPSEGADCGSMKLGDRIEGLGVGEGLPNGSYSYYWPDFEGALPIDGVCAAFDFYKKVSEQ